MRLTGHPGQAGPRGQSGAGYDPFGRGPLAVGVASLDAPDEARGRSFPCELWYPAERGDASGAQSAATALAGARPLVVYSHSSGGHRRSATFLCAHLASHGYAVAAMDHSELVAAELGRRDDETPAARAERIDAVIGSRVPDVRFLLGYLLATASLSGGLELDAERIGLVGHSFGGWTVLAVPDAEPLAGSVVALAPGGASDPRPGILPLTLAFGWGRDVPTLVLAAEDDVPIPLDGVQEMFGRIPGSKRMVVLRRADHQHFVDDVEAEHEAARTSPLPPAAAWMAAEMKPAAELCSGEQAHLFTRALTLAHFDATLLGRGEAERFLAGDVAAELADRGVEAFTWQ